MKKIKFCTWSLWLLTSWVGYVLRFFWLRHCRSNRADLVAQSFIGFLAIIRLFTDLDRLSSISGSNVIAKKNKNVYRYLGDFLGISLINIRLFCHNVSPRSATKWIKPSKDSYYSLESIAVLYSGPILDIAFTL